MTDILVTIRDLRAAHCCCRGGREVLAKYGLDWDKFRKEGLLASELEATGDALILRVVEKARGKEL